MLEKVVEEEGGGQCFESDGDVLVDRCQKRDTSTSTQRTSVCRPRCTTTTATSNLGY